RRSRAGLRYVHVSTGGPMTRSAPAWATAGLCALLAASAAAVDDGSQMSSRFRINYLGYFQHGDKLALFLSPTSESKAWALVDGAGNTLASGVTRDYVKDDYASGDSF